MYYGAASPRRDCSEKWDAAAAFSVECQQGKQVWTISHCRRETFGVWVLDIRWCTPDRLYSLLVDPLTIYMFLIDAAL